MLGIDKVIELGSRRRRQRVSSSSGPATSRAPRSGVVPISRSSPPTKRPQGSSGTAPALLVRGRRTAVRPRGPHAVGAGRGRGEGAPACGRPDPGHAGRARRCVHRGPDGPTRCSRCARNASRSTPTPIARPWWSMHRSRRSPGGGTSRPSKGGDATRDPAASRMRRTRAGRRRERRGRSGCLRAHEAGAVRFDDEAAATPRPRLPVPGVWIDRVRGRPPHRVWSRGAPPTSTTCCWSAASTTGSSTSTGGASHAPPMEGSDGSGPTAPDFAADPSEARRRPTANRSSIRADALRCRRPHDRLPPILVNR